jgi:hypothetical protein
VHTALLLKLAGIANPQYQLMRDSVKHVKIRLKMNKKNKQSEVIYTQKYILLSLSI